MRVKNQNFGDNRDLLKFDLVCQIVNEGLVDSFTYIPMLTENLARGEEPHICRNEAAGGMSNRDLADFLDNAIINEKRDIRQLESFFATNGFKSRIYSPDKLFSHEDRRAYFEGIGQQMLSNALILVDPDRGLKEEGGDEGDLLFDDLINLYERMDDNSYLMFTQRFPDEQRRDFLQTRTAEIRERIPGSTPISLDDLDSIIFFLTRNVFMQGCLVNLLREYTRQYAVRTPASKEDEEQTG
jgi:hypothetical protein